MNISVCSDKLGVHRLIVEGECDSSNVDQLRSAIAVASSSNQLVIDLRAVDFFDARGVSAILEARNACDCLTVLANDRVARLFDIVGLSDMLDPEPDDTANRPPATVEHGEHTTAKRSRHQSHDRSEHRYRTSWGTCLN